MADISIQFHALPEELQLFVKECVVEFNLHVVAMRFFPFGAIVVRIDDLDTVFSASSPYEELALTVGKPSLPVKSNTDFYDKNPDLLRVDIRRAGQKGLEQTRIAARTNNPGSLVIWKKIAKRLKAMTQTGVLAVNPETGASVAAPSFRFTSGAKELAATGIPMLPIAGGCLLKLGMTGEANK